MSLRLDSSSIPASTDRNFFCGKIAPSLISPVQLITKGTRKIRTVANTDSRKILAGLPIGPQGHKYYTGLK